MSGGNSTSPGQVSSVGSSSQPWSPPDTSQQNLIMITPQTSPEQQQQQPMESQPSLLLLQPACILQQQPSSNPPLVQISRQQCSADYPMLYDITNALKSLRPVTDSAAVQLLPNSSVSITKCPSVSVALFGDAHCCEDYHRTFL